MRSLKKIILELARAGPGRTRGRMWPAGRSLPRFAVRQYKQKITIYLEREACKLHLPTMQSKPCTYKACVEKKRHSYWEFYPKTLCIGTKEKRK